MVYTVTAKDTDPLVPKGSSRTVRVSKLNLGIAFVVVGTVAVALGVVLGTTLNHGDKSDTRPSLEYTKKPANMTFTQGTLTQCLDGRHHNVSFTTYGYSESHFYDLDQHSSLKKVHCDIDQTTLLLDFHSAADAVEWFAKLEFENYFVTGGAKWDCMVKNKTRSFMRRVLSASMENANTVKVHAVPARYDEVYETADIAYASGGACDEEGQLTLDKKICLGFNTNCKDGATNMDLPLMQGGIISVTCHECFFGFSAEAFLKVKISGWEMVDLEAGFKNMSMTGAMVFQIDAQKNMGAGIDKVFEMIGETTLLGFNIGPVPFNVFFDVPLEVVAQVNADIHAQVVFGAMANWTLGDHYITWNPKDHWQHVNPTKSASYASVFSAEADFDASADFSLTPTLNMHVDHIYTYRLSFKPDLHMELQGGTQTKQICADANYDMQATAESEISINIPFLNMIDDWHWSKVIWEESAPIAHKCEPFPHAHDDE